MHDLKREYSYSVKLHVKNPFPVDEYLALSPVGHSSYIHEVIS